MAVWSAVAQTSLLLIFSLTSGQLLPGQQFGQTNCNRMIFTFKAIPFGMPQIWRGNALTPVTNEVTHVLAHTNATTPESNSKADTLDQIQVTTGLGLLTTDSLPTTVSSTHCHKTSFPIVNHSSLS